jgi:UDP-N-acetylmuramoylalanine--D-glutamate ligase
MFDFINKFFIVKKIRRKINLKNKKVVVMGIGLHGGGVSMIKWLVQQGARVIATDKKTKEDLSSSLQKLSKLVKNKKIKLVVGRHRLDDFRSADLVIKNPSVPWANTYIKLAKKNRIPVEMDSSLFFKLCPSKKIIGITGTKGKTTTAYIIEAILKKAGKKTIMVGSGQTTVMDRLKLIGKNTYVIFELSSWRLSALRRHRISPRYAVVTNIYPDHLNYYKTMKNYIQDKLAIVKFQKKSNLAVLNYDDEEVREFAEETKAEVSFYSTRDSYSIIQDVYLENEKIKYRTDSNDGTICAVTSLKILGKHNIHNIMAAVALALRLGISPKIIRSAVINFKGVAHRLELVGKRGHKFAYNDSAATTPESAVAGIDSFLRKAEVNDIYLIAGGSSKKLDMSILANKISQTPEVKKVVLLKGQASDELVELIKKKGREDKILTVVDNMTEAVSLLHKEINQQTKEDIENSYEKKIELVKNDTILLSPGCASFGLFDNEFDRGRQFREEIKKVLKIK